METWLLRLPTGGGIQLGHYGSADPARRQAGSGARICTSVGPELYPSGVLGGRAGTFRVGGTGPATGTGPRSAGLGCSGAGREQCGVPAAPVPPHPSQPLHLARRPASPVAPGQQPRLAADIGQGGPTADPQTKSHSSPGCCCCCCRRRRRRRRRHRRRCCCHHYYDYKPHSTLQPPL